MSHHEPIDDAAAAIAKLSLSDKLTLLTCSIIDGNKSSALAPVFALSNCIEWLSRSMSPEQKVRASEELRDRADLIERDVRFERCQTVQ